MLALDGTKIAAQASMNATRTRAQIEAEVSQMLTEASTIDACTVPKRRCCVDGMRAWQACVEL